MDLNRNKWYVRWYFWSLGILDEFLERYNSAEHKERTGTNLCAFMRTILFSAPLVLIFTAIVYATFLGVVTVWPIYLFGLKGYGIGLGVLVVLALLICLGAMVYNSLIEKRLARKQTAKPTNTDETSPGFFHLVWQWLKARKQKVCPLVTFVKSDQEVQP